MQQTSTTILHGFWRLIKPQLDELTAYVGYMIVLMTVSAYQLASHGGIGSDTQGVLSSISAAVHNATAFMSQNDLSARVLLFGFWFIVGTLLYLIAWFIINLLIDAYNDVVISTAFMHPRSFHQSGYWTSVAGRLIVQISAGITLLFYSAFFLIAFTPAWVHSFRSLFSNPTLPQIESAAIAAVSVMVMIHIGVIIFRIVRLRVP